MNQKNLPGSFSYSKIPLLALIIFGGLLALYYLIFDPVPYQNISTAYFSERVAVPFDWVQIGPISFPIQVDNFLIFQEFKSLRPEFTINESSLFAAIVALVCISFLALLSEFKKVYLIIGGAAWIVLVTISNFNGLNIGGVSSNYSLISVLIGTVVPILIFHVWGQSWSLKLKWLAILASVSATIFLLYSFSPIANPLLYLSEHSLIIGLCLSLAWVFWNGHAVISGIYLLITRANRTHQLRVSVQIGLIGVLYLATVFFIFLELTGETRLPFPTFSPLYLIFPMGVFGWIALGAKIDQVPALATNSKALKALHLLGFGISVWLIWKLKLSGNQPAEEFFKHVLTYTQFGFSLFFLIYLFANFLSVMDTGKPVDLILYKPHSLPYYHLRIGGLITMLLLITYSDAIVSVQVNAMTTNTLADYYYQTDQKLEASILYENAWMRYRRNPKAKNATAQLLLELKQPTQAKLHLEESFTEAPQVDNILLLSDQLHAENKIFESVYYLEQGLNYFPNHPLLLNNLALFYTKINKREEAIALFTQATKLDEVLLSNLSALQTMAGKSDENGTVTSQLASNINLLAASNANGNISSEELIKSIENDLNTSSSPLLIHAAYRNLFASQKKNNPIEDLALLDSLATSEQFQSFQMQLQETAVIRSLSAGRIVDAIKNLNGLAFRNPGDAGYYLQLSALILAQNLDFRKAALELEAAQEKGFQAFNTYHWSIFGLGGMPDKAIELREKFNVLLPTYLRDLSSATPQYLELIANFHQQLPETLYNEWVDFEENELKTDLAIRLISHKSHGLNASQIQKLGAYLAEKLGPQDKLVNYLSNPDLRSVESIKSLLTWLNLGEEMTSNPYYTPIILSAAISTQDPLAKYEILNSATEFNQDPILWIEKVKAARVMGLDNYASEALIQMQGWLSQQEISKLESRNY
jgi:tetratricopeptide (TPR) repeat protein